MRIALFFALFSSLVIANDNKVILSSLEVWNCHEPSKSWDYLSRYGGEEGGSQKRNFEGFLTNGLKFIAIMNVTDGERSATHLYSDGKFYREGLTDGVFFSNDAETEKRWRFIFKPAYPSPAKLMDRWCGPSFKDT